MASTNKTTTLELSQFVGTDVPGWLTDYNSDMSKIDAFAAKANSDISGAVQTANGANTTAQAASKAANSASTLVQNVNNQVANLKADISKWKNTSTTNGGNFTGTVKAIYNAALGIINFNGSLTKNSAIAVSDVLINLPQELRPAFRRSAISGSVYTTDGKYYPFEALFDIDGSVKIASTPLTGSTLITFNVTIAAAGWNSLFPNIQ